MADVPLDLQRRLEQRWAAKFASLSAAAPQPQRFFKPVKVKSENLPGRADKLSISVNPLRSEFGHEQHACDPIS